MRIVCFGDSLTFGSVGYSYRKFLTANAKILNRGVNGDTTIGMYPRFRRFINRPINDDVDIYIIAIGTNDVFLPYLTTVSKPFYLQMKPRTRIKHCIMEPSQFRVEYEKYIQAIKKKNKRMIAVGLPYLEITGFDQKLLDERNKIIEDLCKVYQLPFVDPSTIQKTFIKPGKTYSWKHKNLVCMLDGVTMSLLPFTKDWFSRTRKLQGTVDGLHYNSKSAKLIAQKIDAILQEEML